jgi:hypothetical protein
MTNHDDNVAELNQLLLKTSGLFERDPQAATAYP